MAIYVVPGEPGAGNGRVTLSDADGDGDLDGLVASGTASGSRLDVFSNDGLGHFTDHVVSTGVVPFAAVDADGDADVVECDGSPLQPPMVTHVLLGQPDASFVSTVTWNASQLVAVADLDLDGALDVLAWDSELLALRAHMGVGDGSFTDGPVTAVAPIGGGTDRVADFDGDGLPDLLVTVPDPDGHTAIRLGDGQGGFGTTDAVALDMGSVVTLIIADVVADGRPDVVTSRSGGFQNASLAVFPNWTYPVGGPLLDLGYAKPGNGYPVMLASGGFTAGDAVEFHLFSAWPQGPTALNAGFSEAYAPFHGGTLVPSPDVVLGLFVTAAQGDLGVQAHWPPGVPRGTRVTLQFWSQWPFSVPVPYVASSAVRVTAP
ncbi:MAG TPA: VCBS repeat-containing protein [Planctomycetota bacterium]|nr:VCBS repeat-containing protein [Planctomycetota bacterium]